MEQRFKSGRYAGNKWGGKYLRAPDIFYTILEKGKEKLISLGHIVSKTQRNTLEKFNRINVLNENFYLNNNYPYLSSVKDVDSIKIDTKKLNKSIEKTTKKEVDYLVPDIISNRFWGDRHFFIEGGKFVVSDTFFIAILKNGYAKEIISALLNSTLSLFITEVIGRKNLGGGLLTVYGPELKRILICDPNKINKNDINKIKKIYKTLSIRKIKTIFEELGIDQSKYIRDQNPKPINDRKEIDNIIFHELGLTKDEIRETYLSFCELVRQRSDKARSLSKNG